jgi:hypothetical protein
VEKSYDYSEEEINEIVSNIRETIEDYPSYMNNYYEELQFMGHACTIDEKVSQAAVFGLRICLRYYLEEEDFEKVVHLKMLLECIDQPVVCSIDAYIIESIEISLN